MGWGRRRQLERYPGSVAQAAYLFLALTAAVMLAWLSNVASGVAPQIMADFGMSFRFYVMVAAVSIAVGALGALGAGLADRLGRVPLVVGGLLASSLLVLFAVPAADARWSYLGLTACTGVIEGAAGVALPAMVRDFAPQVRRATAMALWALGPVLGSLMVTGVATQTLPAHPDWRFQYRVAGVVGVVVAAVAATWLRELSPGLRNQVMVDRRDRELVELRAAETAARPRRWRSVLGLDVVGSALAISVYLIFYYVVVGFFVVYLVTTFDYSGARANGLANTYWSVSAVALVGAGVISDRLAVRKPVMLLGAAVGAAASIWLAVISRQPEASGNDGRLVAVVVLAAVGNALVFAPWMAAYSETIERRSPAAVATGFAVWSSVNKVVVTLVLVGFTVAVSAPSVLVDDGPRIRAIVTAHPRAAGALVHGQPVPPQDPLSVSELAFLRDHLAEVQRAQRDGPREWQRWWLICAAGQLLFLAGLPLLSGRWRPRTARADLARHAGERANALRELRRAPTADVSRSGEQHTPSV